MRTSLGHLVFSQRNPNVTNRDLQKQIVGLEVCIYLTELEGICKQRFLSELIVLREYIEKIC